MHVANEGDEACTTCPAGSKCPNGIKIPCYTEGIFSYQDLTGQSACKQCQAAAQVATVDGTGCTAGMRGALEPLFSNRWLAPGVYMFDISGGGGGSGATTCSNCGNYGSSQPGGRGERKQFTVLIRFPTVIGILIGRGGGGGHNGNNSRQNDTAGTIDAEWYRTNSCTYSCTQAVACNNGSDGGTTTVTINGIAYSAAGGFGGKGKTWLINNTGGSFADIKAPNHAYACAANPANCGAMGGQAVIQDKPNSRQHSYWSDGYAGESGYVHYWPIMRI
jgi:hypothetical protein